MTTEATVLTFLSDKPTHVDEIVRRSGLPVRDVCGELCMMELKGLVKQIGGMNFILYNWHPI